MALVYFNENLGSKEETPCMWAVETEYSGFTKALAISKNVFNLSEDFSISKSSPVRLNLILKKSNFGDVDANILILDKNERVDDILMFDTKNDEHTAVRVIVPKSDYIGVFFNEGDFICLNEEKVLAENKLNDHSKPIVVGKFGIYEEGAVISVSKNNDTELYELAEKGWVKRSEI